MSLENKKPKRKSKSSYKDWWAEYDPFFIEDTEELTKIDAEVVKARTELKRVSLKIMAETRNAHWASQCWNCLIRTLCEWKGIEPTNPESPNLHKIFKMGEKIEDVVAEGYRFDNSVIARDFPVAIKDPRLMFNISGRVDVVILKDGELIPIEVKSQKDYDERMGGWDGWKNFLPKKEHTAQLLTYMKATGWDKGKLHYFNKNRQIEGRYAFTFSEEFYEDMISYFMLVEETMEMIGEKEPLEFLDVLKYFKHPKTEKRPYPCCWFSPAKDKPDPVGCCQYFDRCKRAYEKKQRREK
jgi:hypothetical protein